MPDDSQAETLRIAMRRLPASRRDQLRLALSRLRGQSERPGSPFSQRERTLIEDLGRALGDDEPETVREGRLVEKLAQTGRLRPGFLVRMLREGRLGLFEAALARLGGFEAAEIRCAMMSRDKPELLALACAAIGMDRGAFPTILSLVRNLNGGAPGGGEEGARRAMGAFGPFPADRAATAFRRAIWAV